jgi:hypothetical protein
LISSVAPTLGSINNLTLAQIGMGAKHPEYSPIGRPRPGVRIHKAGTLHGDGTFEPLGPPINPIKLRPDGMSIGVEIKMASSSFPASSTGQQSATAKVELRSIDHGQKEQTLPARDVLWMRLVIWASQYPEGLRSAVQFGKARANRADGPAPATDGPMRK